jgi:hypothetical protein
VRIAWCGFIPVTGFAGVEHHRREAQLGHQDAGPSEQAILHSASHGSLPRTILFLMSRQRLIASNIDTLVVVRRT